MNQCSHELRAWLKMISKIKTFKKGKNVTTFLLQGALLVHSYFPAKKDVSESLKTVMNDQIQGLTETKLAKKSRLIKKDSLLTVASM